MDSRILSDALAYQKSAYAKSLLQDFQGAIAAYTKAIEIQPDFAEAFKNRGYIYLILGQNIEALADFTQAERLGYSLELKDLHLC
jgi:tetratricopeptide (TPR) repeat protein